MREQAKFRLICLYAEDVTERSLADAYPGCVAVEIVMTGKAYAEGISPKFRALGTWPHESRKSGQRSTVP